jgi:hypothetical protein
MIASSSAPIVQVPDGGKISCSVQIQGLNSTPPTTFRIAGTGVISGTVTIGLFATLQFDPGYANSITGDIHNYGTITGGGFDFRGENLENGSLATIANSEIAFEGGVAQYLSGTGSWSNQTIIMIAGGNSVTLNNPMTWPVPILNLYSGSSLYLDPASPLTLDDPGVAISLHGANSKIYGNGSLDLASSGTLLLYTGAITAPIIVDGYTVHASSINGGSVGQVDVANGGSLTIDSANRLTVTGSLSIDHDIQGSGIYGQGTLDMQGPALSNDGEVGVLSLELDGANVILTGQGVWDPNSLVVDGGKKATLGDDMTWDVLNVQLLGGSTLDLANHGLTLTNSNGPSLVLPGNPPPQITGTGTLHLAGNATLGLGGGSITAPVAFDPGTSQTNVTVSSAGGTLGDVTLANTTHLSLGSNMVVAGSLSPAGVIANGPYTLELKSGVAAGTGSLQSSPTGTVIYSNNATPGSANNTVIPGQYGNLTLSGVAKTLSGTGTTVSGLLTLNSDLQVTGAGNKLGLLPGSTASGSRDVIGTVERSGTFALNQPYTFGNPNNQITFISGSALPATIDVTLAKSAPAKLRFSLPRAYTIAAAGGSGYTATLRLHYLPAESSGLPQAGMCIWSYSPDWTAFQTSAADSTAAWVETQGLSSFSTFALASKTGYQDFLPLAIR